MAFPIAFSVIRYYKSENIEALLAAALPFHIHCQKQRFTTIPLEQITAEITALENAVEMYRNMDWFHLIPVNDKWYPIVSVFYNYLNGFRPDPVKSINLLAFSLDSESVHRSSTQTMMAENWSVLQKVEVPSSQNAIEEFYDLAEEHNKLLTFDIFETDYKTLEIHLETGPVRYSDMFDHVWAFIQNHASREDLCSRLLEELEDGHAVCTSGKVARLMNVVEGYLNGVSTANSKELFQNRMAMIGGMNPSQRREAALCAFSEFKIPVEEQGAWMEALE
jgi:hypothetical protein